MLFNIILILINILILAVIYIFLRKRIDRLTDTQKITSELAGELDTILAEINQATDRNVMIIEDKIGRLEALISEADKRISLLNKSRPAPAVQVETPVKDLTYSHLRRMNTASEMVSPINADSKAAEEVRTLAAEAEVKGSAEASGTDPLQPDDVDKRLRVIELYRGGLDPALISSVAGLSLGEVELIISLHRESGGGRG